PQDVGLGQRGAAAELVVDRLPADASLLGDLRERDLRPRPLAQQRVGRVEDRLAQQLARRDRVGRTAHAAPARPWRRTTLSRTRGWMFARATSPPVRASSRLSITRRPGGV